MANVTSTTAANLLVSRWKAEIQLDATEELVVAKDYWDADGEKIGDNLYIRKVAPIAATAPTLGSFHASSLTYTSNTEARTTVTASPAYGAVRLERDVMNQMLNDVELATAYRKQIANGLATYIDVNAADDVANISGQVGGAGPITRPMLAQANMTLSLSAKNAVKPGDTMYFIYHTSEKANVLAIPEITAADIRGDGVGANVTGYVWKALGMTLSDSSNVYQSGGITYNFLHIPRCMVLAYNERPNILPPEPDGLTSIIIGYAEFGVAENYDAYGCGVLSS